MSWWHRVADLFLWAPRRRMDLLILWPSCKRQAQDLVWARDIFRLHIYNDTAWTARYMDRELEEILHSLE